MLLKFLTTARDDLREIEKYFEQIGDPSAAASVTQGLIQQCRRLASLSGVLGTDRAELRVGLRSTPHRRYVIFFRYTTDTVEIVNILHGNRDIVGFYDDA